MSVNGPGELPLDDRALSELITAKQGVSLTHAVDGIVIGSWIKRHSMDQEDLGLHGMGLNTSSSVCHLLADRDAFIAPPPSQSRLPISC